METLNGKKNAVGFIPCFQFVKRMNGNFWCLLEYAPEGNLLPIREAYEWKPSNRCTPVQTVETTCFQFVKRMNGNPLVLRVAS